MMIKVKENAKQESFSSYMMRSFDMIAELSLGEKSLLQSLFNSIHGNDFGVQAFMDEFGFEKRDFIGFYDLIRNPNHYPAVQEFGKRCSFHKEMLVQSGKGLN